MNKKRFYILVIVVLLISNAFLLAMFIMAPQRPGPNNGPKAMIVEKLHLDESQVKEFDKLIVKHQLGIREHTEKLNKAKQNLYNTLSETNSPNDSLYSIIASENESIEKLNYTHFEELKALCKPDQLDDFNKMTKELGKLFDKKIPPKKK